MINSQFKKTTQALSYLIDKDSLNKVNVLLLMKLIWAADRYNVRNYGSLVTGYEYRALPNGPVSSIALDVANGSDFLSPEQLEYSKKYVVRNNENVFGIDTTETDYLSETDKEALDFAWTTFGNMDRYDVRDITHEYPEWKKFEEYFKSGSSSEDIDVLDFFENPDTDTYFTENEDLLELNKAKFEENLKIRKLIRG